MGSGHTKRHRNQVAVKLRSKCEFERRYGRRPRGVLGHMYDILWDAYVTGWILGYDDANKNAKRRGEK